MLLPKVLWAASAGPNDRPRQQCSRAIGGARRLGYNSTFTFDGEFARSALVFLEKSDDVAQSRFGNDAQGLAADHKLGA
jgi:hypothetical protein